MILLKGGALSQKIIAKAKEEIKKYRLSLTLAAILVGEDSASKVFLRQKENVCRELGINFKIFKFPSDIKGAAFKKEVWEIANDPAHSGVIIQLPLPEHLRAGDQEILNLVPPEKDLDILSEQNLGKFYSGTLKVLPPVVSAISYLLREYKIGLKSKKVLVVGAGRLVGFPLAVWLLKEKATVSVINEFTENISAFTKKADIIVSGAGKSGLIKGEMVKQGVVVIDAGISFERGKLTGDVDFKSVAKKASKISPVPGGIGPLTVACLMENLININLPR